MTAPAAPKDQLPAKAALAFAPLHKRAFGTAVGLVCGALVFLVTAVATLFPNGRADFLSLLAEYFTGYSVSWRGAAIGFGWACVAGFTAGWFLAFCRNVVLAISLAYLRARMELDATRDLMDHI